MSKYKIWLWGGLLLVVCGIGILFTIKQVTENEPKPSVTTEKPLATLSQQKVQVAAQKVDTVKKVEFEKPDKLSTFIWTENARQIYHYLLTTHINVNTALDNASAATWSDAHLSLMGFLNMRVFNQTNDKVYVGFQLSDLRVTQNQQRFPILENLYQSFFMVALTPEGELLDFHFPAYMEKTTDQISLMEVIRSMQFIFPAIDKKTSSVDQWEQQETHASGTYIAQYQRKSANFYKTKKFYNNVSYQTQQVATLDVNAKIIASEAYVTISDQKNWLTTYKGYENFEIGANFGKIAKTTVNAEMELADASVTTDPSLYIWQASANYQDVLTALANMTTLDIPSGWADLEKAALREQLAHVQLENIVNELHQLTAQGYDLKIMLDYIQRLEQYLEVYPERAHELADLLKNTPLNKHTTDAVVQALKGVGHFQAQQVLAELITDGSTVNENVTDQAIMASGLLPKPDPIISDALWHNVQTSDKHIDTALLALGSNSFHFNEQGDYALAEQVQSQLIDYLQTATNPAAKTLALKGLNNARAENVLPIVEPYLTEETSYLRAAAHQVLGNLTDAKSQEILMHSLAQDKSSNVRKTVLQALRKRPDRSAPTVIEPMGQLLETETDSRIQAGIVQYLGEQKQDNPTAEAILKQQLEKEDLSRDMRKKIYTAIYQ